jgi:predicted RND superfamily exporter protein
MPALKNPRWEIFAQGRAEGLPLYKAYLRAGYKCSAEVAMTSASALIRNPQVRARLRELIDRLAEKQMITRETLVAEYEQVIALAHEVGQPAAAATAIKEKQRLMELDPASKNINVNINATFNQMTDDELRFEVASMVNELRAMKGQPPLALPAKKEETDK